LGIGGYNIELKCSLCGHEFDENMENSLCAECNIKITKNCNLVACPNCGFEMPKDSHMNRFFKKIKSGKNE
jgi:NMD protein affecting ribosome stability and mRNA decay